MPPHFVLDVYVARSGCEARCYVSGQEPIPCPRLTYV
jgi:hypothetical protein